MTATAPALGAPALRRAAAAVAAALSLIVVAGCGGGRALRADEVVEQFETIAEDLLAAIETVRPMEWDRTSPRIIEPGAEDCRYSPGAWNFTEPLYPEPGEGMDWDPWRQALDPVLEDHGFTELGREKRMGASLRLESTGPGGALLVLNSMGQLRITEVRVDAQPCEESTLGL